jgi:hypothetical protein
MPSTTSSSTTVKVSRQENKNLVEDVMQENSMGSLMKGMTMSSDEKAKMLNLMMEAISASRNIKTTPAQAASNSQRGDIKANDDNESEAEASDEELDDDSPGDDGIDKKTKEEESGKLSKSGLAGNDVARRPAGNLEQDLEDAAESGKASFLDQDKEGEPNDSVPIIVVLVPPEDERRRKR